MKLTRELLRKTKRVIFINDSGHKAEAIIHNEACADFIYKHYKNNVISIYGSYYLTMPNYLIWLDINVSRD